MKILVIGSGISGLTAAIECAKQQYEVLLVSPYPSERAQSVMAAGGINAVAGGEDSISCHVEDTLRAGRMIAGRETVTALCEDAPQILAWLERLGVAFNRTKEGISRRAFGGQTYRRTAFAGASTGKQIVTALVQECRKYECQGRIKRMLGYQFHSALIKDNVCYGALCRGLFQSAFLRQGLSHADRHARIYLQIKSFLKRNPDQTVGILVLFRIIVLQVFVFLCGGIVCQIPRRRLARRNMPLGFDKLPLCRQDSLF